jgi:hypothetical protein
MRLLFTTPFFWIRKIMSAHKNSDKWLEVAGNQKRIGGLTALRKLVKAAAAPICALLAARYTSETDDDVLGDQVTLPDALMKPNIKDEPLVGASASGQRSKNY